eukprot:gene8390-12927_t
MAREVFNQSMSKHGGSIVNMLADMWGGMPGMGHSGAARSGMDNFTKTAAFEWGYAGVRVNAVAPGWIASSGMDTYEGAFKAVIPTLREHVPLKRIGTESEVSAAIVFLLSPAAAFVSGSTLRIDGAASLGSRAWPLHKAQPPSVSFNAMPVIDSQLDAHSPQFAQNREAMLTGVNQLRQLEQNLLGKAAEAKARFDKRGQLLPRERLNLLLDPGAPFLELASLAGYKLHDDKDGSAAGGGLIAGIGYVSGVRMLVVANNSAIKGGTISPSGLKKSLRLQQIAMENKLPVVTLAESGGANLNYAAEIFVEGARSFANQARMSAMGLPQITVVHGSATAGGAYQPGLSDYVVVVRGK